MPSVPYASAKLNLTLVYFDGHPDNVRLWKHINHHFVFL